MACGMYSNIAQHTVLDLTFQSVVGFVHFSTFLDSSPVVKLVGMSYSTMNFKLDVHSSRKTA